MPTEFHIDTAEELISISVQGETTLGDFQMTAQALASSTDYRPEWPHLVDLRDMQFDAPDPQIAPAIEATCQEYRNRIGGSVAVVIAADLNPETCANIFHFTCNVDAVELFDDYALAIKWLIRAEMAKGMVLLGRNQEGGPNEPHDHPEQVGA